MSPSLAIVVPAGPGDGTWTGLLPQLVDAEASRIALVLPEGEPLAPATLPVNLSVVRSPPGRALQLNAGAAATRSDWLWFVHADSRVTEATIRCLHDFVAADGDAVGFFDLRFLDDGPRLTALNALGARFRSRCLGLPFGDQGLLMPRRVFEALGGFDEHARGGEDHSLVWSARIRGVPLHALHAPIYTSARKYAQHGWWGTTSRHLRLTCSQAWRFSGVGHRR
ncbi:MAG: glycosyltransferase [Pseudomonadota bacterium]|nr:glycosyltransferase [Pseudomonadota bacterium]